MIRRPLLAAVAAGILVLAGCDRGPGTAGSPKFQSTDITGADFGRDFRLTAHDGAPRTLADFRGKVVVVFFGFVHCPDVCPTTLAKLGVVMKSLGPAAEKVQVLLVTVDPERDTTEILREYTTSFHPSFLGLTGTPDDIGRTTREFRVIAQKQAPTSPEAGYTVDHTSAIYVFDAEGRLRLYIPGTQSAAVIEQDLRTLIGSR